MSVKKKHISAGEIFFLALLSILGAFLLQRFPPGEEEAPEPPVQAAEAEAEETRAEPVYWDEELLYETLEESLLAREPHVILPYDCTDALFDVFHRVLADHPEMFWLTGSGSYVKNINGDGVVVRFTPETLVSEEVIALREVEFAARREEVLRRLEGAGTVWEQLLLLHDLLVDETDYDTNTARLMDGEVSTDEISRSTGAYGCLVDRLAVCSGYAAAFQMLAGDLGVNVVRVQGTDLENGSPHEWNLAELDGVWYHVDVTWDDPVFTGDPAEGYRTWDYFLVTTDEITRTHRIEDRIPPCPDSSLGWYRVNGLCLDEYDYEGASRILSLQDTDGWMILKLPGKEELERAVEDLIGNQKVFEIPAIRDTGAGSVRYVSTEAGTLSIRLEP